MNNQVRTKGNPMPLLMGCTKPMAVEPLNDAVKPMLYDHINQVVVWNMAEWHNTRSIKVRPNTCPGGGHDYKIVNDDKKLY